MNNAISDFENTMKEFADVCAALESVDIEKLPFELQFKVLNEYGKLSSSVKNFTREIRKIVVAAAILGRTK